MKQTVLAELRPSTMGEEDYFTFEILLSKNEIFLLWIRDHARSPKQFGGQMNENLNQIGKYGGTRFLPFAFTECGVAMLSSVLTSKEAALINITIMRTFVKMRSFLAIESITKDKVENLERTTNHLFKIVFERLPTPAPQDVLSAT